MQNNDFRDVSGVRIRRQYFNYILLALLMIFLYSFIMRTFTPMMGGFDIREWAERVGSLVLNIGGLTLPFAVLSVLNFFCFGKTVCVLNEEGIHYRNGIIRWDDILYLKFECVTLSKLHPYYPSYITVVCKDNLKGIEITSAPFSMALAARKYKSGIRIKPVKEIFILVGIVIGFAAMCLFSYYF